MIITETRKEDLKQIMDIVEESRVFLRNNGVDQWQGPYPLVEDFENDIKNGNAYVVKEGDEVLAMFAVIGHDNNYDYIEDGKWLDESDYIAIHRVGVKYKGRGICGFIFEEMKKRYDHIRVDTHADNIPMNTCIRKHGFKYCGVVYMEDHSPRNAYEYMKEI